jgi:hypothetical protein
VCCWLTALCVWWCVRESINSMLVLFIDDSVCMTIRSIFTSFSSISSPKIRIASVSCCVLPLTGSVDASFSSFDFFTRSSAAVVSRCFTRSLLDNASCDTPDGYETEGNITATIDEYTCRHDRYITQRVVTLVEPSVEGWLLTSPLLPSAESSCIPANELTNEQTVKRNEWGAKKALR